MTKRTCSVNGCEKQHKARGWCHTHYTAELRSGRIEVAPKLSDWDRFWANVDVAGICWQWDPEKLQNGTGYGNFGVRGDIVGAHRYAWTILVGDIPEGMHIDHLCRNRGCVNPDHLEIVTIEENVKRGYGITAHNARKTHCVRNHEFTESNTRYRLGSNGKTWRKCRACAREDAALTRQRARCTQA